MCFQSNLALLALLARCSAGVKISAPVEQANPWPSALGPSQQGSTGLRTPPNLTKALKWSFHHPRGKYHTTIVGGPVIDAKKNLYIAMNDGIRKVSPDGAQVWFYQ